MPMPSTLQPLYERAIACEISAHHAHELRNLLGGIAASTFLVRQRLESEPPIDPRIERALDVIDARVRDGIALAERGPRMRASIPPTELVVTDVLDELLDSVSLPSGVRVLRPRRASFRVVAHREELACVVYCLLENAIDAIQARGRGSVRIRIDEGSGGEGRVVVVDDGVGLSPDAAEEAFTPLFTTKPGHLGMGLGVARRLAVQMGAELTLSGTARGARASFTVTSPRRSVTSCAART